MIDAPMSDDEIVAHLRSECDAASHFYNTDLADRQANALEFYDCEPFGDEEDGQSQYIEPVVEQTVDDMTVDIMEAFVGGDRVVEFEANDEASEAAASEATEAVHYLFMRRQKGFRITLDWLQSGLTEIFGVVKVACVEERKVKKHRATVPEEMLALFDEAQIVEAADNGDGSFNVTIREETTVKRFEVLPIPSEEFAFSPRMRSIDDKVYRAHSCPKTLSDLIAMGFDRETVEALPVASDMLETDQRAQARWRDENWADKARKGNNREVLLHEEYDWLDIDGDGISELVRAFRVEDVLLGWEEWEEQPFVGWCPYPRAHRMVGKGLAEKVMPDQRVESVITRQMLDGLYASNTPRLWLPEDSIGDTTIDELLTVRPGSIVRGKGSMPPPVNLSDNFDLGKSLNVLERFSQRRQSRTGILELGKGMDKDALNDTARGQAQLMAAGEKQIRYVARNFGEAMAEMFLKLMRLVRAHGEQLTVKIGKNFTPIDPSTWPEDMDLSIKVGLGTNGKDRRIGYRMSIAGIQAEAKQNGIAIVTDKHLYNTAAGLIRDMDLGDPGDFFLDPEGEINPETGQPVAKPEKPDPEMMKAQADAMLQAEKMKADQEASAAKLDFMRQEAGLKAELAREQAEAEAQLARDKADFEADLARERLAQEFELSQQRMALEAQMANHKASLAEQDALSRNRPGGSLAA